MENLCWFGLKNIDTAGVINLVEGKHALLCLNTSKIFRFDWQKRYQCTQKCEWLKSLLPGSWTFSRFLIPVGAGEHFPLNNWTFFYPLNYSILLDFFPSSVALIVKIFFKTFFPFFSSVIYSLTCSAVITRGMHCVVHFGRVWVTLIRSTGKD